MSSFFSNKKIRRLMTGLAIIITLAVLIYIIVQGRHYFSRRGIIRLQSFITPYGSFSPLVIVLLIVLSTVIPPLPLPIPLIEMAAGLMFGFWQGCLLVWFSQILSSILAFGITRFIGKRLFNKFLNNHFLLLYQRYIHKKGPLAIFITRATMSAPFNIVSFLAGLTQMSTLSFSTATTLGTIPESLLYPFIGSIIRHVRLKLWYIFIIVVILGAVGPIFTYFMIKRLEPTPAKHKK